MAEAAAQLRPDTFPRRDVITVTNPATLETIREVPVTDATGVRTAVQRARDAQISWARLPFHERGAALKRFRDAIVDNKDRIASVIAAETGRPRGDVYPSELLGICDAIGYWAKHAATYLADEKVRPHLL